MISEIVLSIVILALLVYIYMLNKGIVAEREKMIKLLMAKNLQEVTDNEIIEKMAPEKPTEQLHPDVTTLDPDDDILFDKHIEVEAKA